MDREGDFVRGIQGSPEIQKVVADPPHDLLRIAAYSNPDSVEIEFDGGRCRYL
jgi:hypothetical protein